MENDNQMALQFQVDKLLTACEDYIKDFKVFKNTHQQAAELVIEHLNPLFSTEYKQAQLISGNDSEQGLAGKRKIFHSVIFTLYHHLKERNSQKFLNDYLQPILDLYSLQFDQFNDNDIDTSYCQQLKKSLDQKNPLKEKDEHKTQEFKSAIQLIQSEPIQSEPIKISSRIGIVGAHGSGKTILGRSLLGLECQKKGSRNYEQLKAWQPIPKLKIKKGHNLYALDFHETSEPHKVRDEEHGQFFGSKAFILAFDRTDQSSFGVMKTLYGELKKELQRRFKTRQEFSSELQRKKPVIIVGTHSDLRSQIAVEDKDVKAFMSQHDEILDYITTSQKDNKNINKVINTLMNGMTKAKANQEIVWSNYIEHKKQPKDQKPKVVKSKPEKWSYKESRYPTLWDNNNNINEEKDESLQKKAAKQVELFPKKEDLVHKVVQDDKKDDYTQAVKDHIKLMKARKPSFKDDFETYEIGELKEYEALCSVTSDEIPNIPVIYDKKLYDLEEVLERKEISGQDFNNSGPLSLAKIEVPNQIILDMMQAAIDKAKEAKEAEEKPKMTK